MIEQQVATGDTIQYHYNARNLLTEVVNARQQSQQLTYDAADRLVTVTDPSGTVSYTYDANGNVLTVTNAQGTISRQYDALNRVTQYTDARGNTLQYAYDAVGNLMSLTYPDGKQVHYQYDAADRLVQVTDWANRQTSYSYDANGRLLQTDHPNGSQSRRVYDAAGQLLQQMETHPSGLMVRFDFTYDAAGRISRETTTPTPTVMTVSLPRMTYSAANRLATFEGQAVEFDVDGNLSYGPLAGGWDNFSFDSRNRLTQAGNVSYQYDAEDQRLAVTDNGQTTQYVVNSQPALSQVLVRT